MTYDKHGILVILPVNFIGKTYEEFSKIRGDSIFYKGFDYEYDYLPSDNFRIIKKKNRYKLFNIQKFWRKMY